MEVGDIGRAERLDGESHAPVDQQVELDLRRMTAPERARRQRRWYDETSEIERIQLISAVLGGGHRLEPEGLARGDDLGPRPREAGHCATRAPPPPERHRGGRGPLRTPAPP